MYTKIKKGQIQQIKYNEELRKNHFKFTKFTFFLNYKFNLTTISIIITLLRLISLRERRTICALNSDQFVLLTKKFLYCWYYLEVGTKVN